MQRKWMQRYFGFGHPNFAHDISVVAHNIVVIGHNHVVFAHMVLGIHQIVFHMWAMERPMSQNLRKYNHAWLEEYKIYVLDAILACGL